LKKEVLRMCVVCRQMKQKNELLRIVFTNDECTEYIINANKVNGRGAYICKDQQCINKCIKSKAFNKIYKRNLPSNFYEDLSKVELNEG